MSNAGAQFEEVPDSPELNATPIDMSEEPENVPMQLQDTGLDEIRPEVVAKEDPIYFDEKGSMVTPEEPEEGPEPEPEQAAADTQLGIPKADSTPDYLQALANSQKQMAEYLTLQQQLKQEEERAAQLEQQREEEAYYQSDEFITEMCNKSGLDAEDPIHRQLIHQRLDMQRQSYEYNQRLQMMEQRYYQQELNNTKQRNQQTLQSTFNEAASQYKGVSAEMLDAARHQANLLVETGMTPDRAVTESMKFIRLAAKQSTQQVTNKVSDRQKRLDKINNLGPGRGAKSHRKTQITMAEADRLIEKYGFVPR